MNHEDMFRLHLSGLGKYRDNKLIIDATTSVEFIDGFNKYIIYDYWFSGEINYMTECSYGKHHGRRTSYWRAGTIFSVCDFADGEELPGTYVMYGYEG